MINRLPLALGAGYLGSIANILVISLINITTNDDFSLDKNFVYKQVFWGGLWAILYCLPVLKNQWIVKGIVVSALASFCTFFIFQSIPLNALNILRAFIVNIVFWGGVSSFTYHKAIMSQDNNKTPSSKKS